LHTGLLLERSRDLDISVRIQFYKRISQIEDPWNFLQKDEMFTIIKNGLMEREEKVKVVFFEMLFHTLVTDFEKIFRVN
jgi:hypothetical protein